jgi:hypothetical protein
MRYEERIGRSKLSVVRDGVRFLQTIFTGVLCYRPEQLLLILFGICMAAVVLIAAYPVEFYLQNRSLEDWMIYRFVACSRLSSCGLALLLATALTYRMADFGPRRRSADTFWPSLVASILHGPSLICVLVFLLFVASAILWPGIVQYCTHGSVTLHWSRLLAGSFSLSCAFQTALFALLLKVVAVWKQQQISSSVAPAERRAERHFGSVERVEHLLGLAARETVSPR